MYDSFKIVNGDLTFNSLGQLDFISGEAAIIQLIEHKLNTIKGTLFYDENYGISVDFSKLKKTEKNVSQIQSAINDALSDDSRIASSQILEIKQEEIKLQIILSDDTILNITFK